MELINEQEQYNGLKNELSVLDKALKALFYASFPGTYAQDVAIAQMYLQGLYNRIKHEVDRLAPANEPLSPAEMSGAKVSPLGEASMPDPNKDKTVVA